MNDKQKIHHSPADITDMYTVIITKVVIISEPLTFCIFTNSDITYFFVSYKSRNYSFLLYCSDQIMLTVLLKFEHFVYPFIA